MPFGDACNYVGQRGDGWIAVVGCGDPIGPFLSQSDAERAYNANAGPPPAASGGATGPIPPAAGYPEVTLDCSRGQGAPVNGGCWCCIDGLWDTDPRYCRDPAWAVRCGNAGGGGSGGTQPQPGAPTSPASGPSMPDAGQPPSQPPSGAPSASAPPAPLPRALLVAGATVLVGVVLLR
jgi:hypothetical protein